MFEIFLEEGNFSVIN